MFWCLQDRLRALRVRVFRVGFRLETRIAFYTLELQDLLKPHRVETLKPDVSPKP